MKTGELRKRFAGYVWEDVKKHHAENRQRGLTGPTRCRFFGRRLKIVTGSGGFQRYMVCRSCGRDIRWIRLAVAGRLGVVTELPAEEPARLVREEAQEEPRPPGHSRTFLAGRSAEARRFYIGV